jgi:hypothetical protein
MERSKRRWTVPMRVFIVTTVALAVVLASLAPQPGLTIATAPRETKTARESKTAKETPATTTGSGREKKTGSGGTGGSRTVRGAEPTATEVAPTAPEAAPTATMAAAPTATTGGLPAVCGESQGRRIDVASATELNAALMNAQPGDVIVLADGVYAGRFQATVAGTATARITICGTRAAILDGGSVSSSGPGFLLQSHHWTLAGFTVTNAQVGIAGRGASQNVIRDIAVHHVGQAGIHLREFSSDNLIERVAIQDTGLYKPEYGEGVYLGTTSSQWCERTNCQPDASDLNVVSNSVIGPNVTAQHIDIKEGTQAGVISGNVLDGRGQTTANHTNSAIMVTGSGYAIVGNAIQNAINHGVQIEMHEYANSGNNNVIHGNVVTAVPGYGFYVKDWETTGNMVGCDNTVTNAGQGFANVPCT